MSSETTTPPVLKRPAGAMGSHEAKPQEIESPLSAGKKSPCKKKALMKTKLDPVRLFEAASEDASREISGLFAKFADVLCEKAATDTSMIQELDSILNEARSLQAYLVEKKNHLRQTLALISDKLYGR